MDEPAVALAGDGGLVRLRLDLSYDGTAFAGWAAQPERRTVQGVVEATLASIVRHPVRLTVAGRTDAGVHATGQVAHVDVQAAFWHVDGLRLLHRLAGALPDDVRAHGVTIAPAGFDARFGALWRRYVYRVGDTPWGVAPLRRHDTLRWPRPLDDAALRGAAARLLGRHDFAAFCRRRDGATTVRTLQVLDWGRGSDGVLAATVQADAFCHSMVRGLIGSLLAVGAGQRPVEWPATLLDASERRDEVHVAPARGLALVAVGYPADTELAAHARLTRSRRTAAR